MAWKRLLTEDDIAGLADPTATIGGAAVNGVATTAMRSDAAPALGPLTRDLDFLLSERVQNFEISQVRPIYELQAWLKA